MKIFGRRIPYYYRVLTSRDVVAYARTLFACAGASQHIEPSYIASCALNPASFISHI